MSFDDLLALRREKDEFFKTDPYSPLTPEQQAAFTGLSYYDPNPELDLVVDVEPLNDSTPILMQTSTGDVREYIRYARFSFYVDGQEARLTIYAAPTGFFLPFVDANAGIETYSAGRYLEPEALDERRFHVDFNQAYNPYCAYNDAWSCPLTPPENRLKVPIRAGEKLPTGTWAKPLDLPADDTK